MPDLRVTLGTRLPVLHHAAQQARGLVDLGREVRNLPLRRTVRRLVAAQPPVDVLVVGVYEPGSELVGEVEGLRRSAHRVRFTLASRKGPAVPALREETVLEDVEGLLFENANRLLAADPRPTPRWTFRVDSDVRFPPGFVDTFVAVAEAADLSVAGPAMTRRSYWSWPIARVRPRTLVRRTTFVEIGPVVAIRADAAPVLLPFPAEAGMGWGLDLHWSYLVEEHGWRMGIVDATPIRHERAPGGTYSQQVAARAAEAFAAAHPLMDREQVATLEVIRSL